MISIVYLFLFISNVVTFDYSVIINEKSSIEKSIYDFSHPYELLNNFQSNFNLTNNNTQLILTKVIDRDYWCSQQICSCDHCSFVLELFSNYNQIPTFSTINVTINDINDHTCQFLDTHANISLSESIHIGHRFLITRAIDYDSGSNGKLSFELLDHVNYFQLDIIELSMNEYSIYGVVKNLLDREINEKFELIIEARDHGLPRARINRTKVTIEILDENDNPPRFNQTEYSIQSLPENTVVGTVILRVWATDDDKGLNGLVRYSIINPPSSSSFPFVIDAKTGAISLQSPLDYESTRSYRFLIRASDSGVTQSLFTDAWFSVSIQDVNDCPVEILFLANRRFQYDSQTLFIFENTEINNLTLGYIRLFDRDTTSSKLSISLMALDKQAKQEYELTMSTQSNSYILIAKHGIFDREMQSDVNLRFVASDGLLTSIFDLKIRLLDVNDNPSQFLSNPVIYYIEELANYRMIQTPIEDYQLTIGYLNAVDKDEGENAISQFELEPNPLIKIDSNTGRLYLTQPLDREQVKSIELKAKAINIAEPKWVTSVQIQIHVLDMNDNIPKCSATYHRITIPEDFSIDKPLIKINASDPDHGTNGTISYGLGTMSTWPFVIDNITGEIFSKHIFDYESDSKEFLLLIDLEDNGKPIQNHNKNACQLEIFLEDVNDNRPQLADDEQALIFIDLDNDYENKILSLNATDKDSGLNGKIRYSLRSIESNINLNDNQTLFELDQNGSLYLTYRLSQVCLFKLQILLEDYGYPSLQTLIEIHVAFGSSSNPQYSSFEKIQLYFEEKTIRPNSAIFIYGLSILAVTIFFLLLIIIICGIFRQQRKRDKAAMISRNKLFCSSSQQLTTSDSTVTSNTTSSSIEHQQIIRPSYFNETTLVNHQRLSMNCSSPESHTYKILHVPVDMNYFEKEKVDNISCDHGYHESFHTGSSMSTSPEQFSSEVSTNRDYMFNQLPYFVTKCKSLRENVMVEMNVDGSDEDGR